MTLHSRTLLNLLAFVCLSVLSVATLAQPAAEKKPQPKAVQKAARNIGEFDAVDAQRRTFAISLVKSLADEARSYHDQALRPHVLVRAADALWDVDSDTARTLFRRAWEAAEKGDAEELTLKTQDGALPMVTALRQIGGRDLRADVLGLAARRDPALGEEFLAKLKDEITHESKNSKTDRSKRNAADSWSVSEQAVKRLLLARRLLTDGQVELAQQIAAPVVNDVNANSIGFLSALREKRPEAADQKFALLLARVEFHPSSDANTVSGLSSYAFTPGFYVTFSVEGGARFSQPEESTGRLSTPNLPVMLRHRFFQVASSILLRPLPPPDQDFTSSGRTGKYMVVKRLLPLFDQYAPEAATALRSQLTALAGDEGMKLMGFDNPLLTQGLQPEETAGNTLEKLQDLLDRAKTTQERDWIYADAACALSTQGDARAQDLADKIDNPDRRAQVRRYVDFELVQVNVRKEEASEVVRLAKAGQLTHTQRAWAYTELARLLIDSERPRALGFLEDAANEARRIDSDDPDRPRLLIAVTMQLVTADRVRAWELMGEAVKSANSAERFTGASVQLHFPLATRKGLKRSIIGGDEFGVAGVLRSLAKDDLHRAVDLAKGFEKDAPRAAAILAVASALLKK